MVASSSISEACPGRPPRRRPGRQNLLPDVTGCGTHRRRVAASICRPLHGGDLGIGRAGAWRLMPRTLERRRHGRLMVRRGPGGGVPREARRPGRVAGM
jgi:hypothetical protein